MQYKLHEMPDFNGEIQEFFSKIFIIRAEVSQSSHINTLAMFFMVLLYLHLK